MEWQQILGFYHVAKLGSFTKAGEVTFRTQSALSQQVKALEEELACRLLERIGKKRLRLTPAGEIFFRFAEAILERAARLEEDLNALAGQQSGHLRIAAPFTTLYHLFRQAFTEYRRRFPQVQLTIWDRSQPDVIELVKSGEIDFGVALESLAPKDLATRRWHKVETFLLTPPGHPLTKVKRVTMKQIAKYPLILPPKTPGYPRGRRVEEDLKKLGLDFHVIMESSNVELSSLYVEMGLGISFATMVKDLPLPRERKLAFISLTHYFPPDFIAIVRRRDKILSPYHSSFLEILLGNC
ncbi:MAG: LysR family transcriptional regulator [Thermodesulfobacteriota bacterium]